MGEVHVARPRRIEPRGLSRIDAAQYLGVSASKFDQLREDGRVSSPRMIDGRLVWDRHDLDLDFEAFPLEADETPEEWTAAL
jgi:hypothetical protein